MQTTLLEEINKIDAPSSITLDEHDLRDLKEQKILSAEVYFYFAVKLDYPGDNPVIDREAFCQRWELKPGEFDVLVAKLAKKNAWMKKPERYVQLMLNFPAED